MIKLCNTSGICRMTVVDAVVVVLDNDNGVRWAESMARLTMARISYCLSELQKKDSLYHAGIVRYAMLSIARLERNSAACGSLKHSTSASDTAE
jgi:hypothetical protein